MKAPEEKILVAGPVGNIDTIMERPDAPKGIALIAHPHPMGGGANTNKVAYTLARTFVSLGYAAFRPNFRGVGATEGEHDDGADKHPVDDVHVSSFSGSPTGTMSDGSHGSAQPECSRIAEINPAVNPHTSRPPTRKAGPM